MKLIDQINRLRNDIRTASLHIDHCAKTEAGHILKQELKEDRDFAAHKLGLLVSNSAVKICLQSEYTS